MSASLLAFLIILVCGWPALAAAASSSGSVAEVSDRVAQLRQDILPQLGAELSALHREAASGIEAVGAGRTVIGMRRSLVAMDEDLGLISQALRAEALDVSALMATIDRFGATAVGFGRDMELLVGGDSRFDSLRLENEQARKRLLRLARQYTRMADAVSELLGLLPDAVEARYRQLNPGR